MANITSSCSKQDRYIAALNIWLVFVGFWLNRLPFRERTNFIRFSHKHVIASYIVLYSQLFSTQTYSSFEKFSTSGLFLKYSYKFSNFNLDIFIKSVVYSSVHSWANCCSHGHDNSHEKLTWLSLVFFEPTRQLRLNQVLYETSWNQQYGLNQSAIKDWPTTIVVEADWVWNKLKDAIQSTAYRTFYAQLLSRYSLQNRWQSGKIQNWLMK